MMHVKAGQDLIEERDGQVRMPAEVSATCVLGALANQRGCKAPGPDASDRASHMDCRD